MTPSCWEPSAIPPSPPGVLERGLLLRLRFALDHYVNLRPSVYYPGVPTPLADPGDIDFVVVREGTEGLYCGNGGVVRQGTAHEIATEVSVNTAYGVERLVRYAFAKARARAAKHLTLVHKHNVLVHAGDLWRRTVEAVGTEYPEVAVDYCHVDAATIYMVTDPGRFDVIVTDNLFGDILTDEAGAVTGGIGLSASGNINPERAFPSMFEPVHGSAPDIAGQGKADPTATISAVASCSTTSGCPKPRRRSRPESLRTWPLGAVAPSAPPARSVTPSPRQWRPGPIRHRFETPRPSSCPERDRSTRAGRYIPSMSLLGPRRQTAACLLLAGLTGLCGCDVLTDAH